MRANYRKLLIGLVIVVALGAFAYHSRHKLHLADFTWKKFMHSISLANIPLLLLAIVRSVLLLRTSRGALATLFPLHWAVQFLGNLQCHAHGLRLDFSFRARW